MVFKQNLRSPVSPKPPGLLSELIVTWSVVNPHSACAVKRNSKHINLNMSSPTIIFLASYCVTRNYSIFKVRQGRKFIFLTDILRSHGECNGCIASAATVYHNVRSWVDGKVCQQRSGNE